MARMTGARLVLIVGAPRSGTTWLQTLLGAHPQVATPQETDIFRLYLQPMAEAWDRQVAKLLDQSHDHRRKGLPTVIDAEQFHRAGRVLVDTMIQSVRAHKPDANVIVEKSPGHSLCTDVAERFWPGATFLHMIRDGRDVAASLVAASKSFGAAFAPAEVGDAAQMWKSRLVAARKACAAPGGYTEIRYEDLHTNGASTLQRAYAACGIEVPLEECAEIIARFGFDEMAERGAVAPSIITTGEFAGDERTRSEPKGFFREGVVGSWRKEWKYPERHDFDVVAGELLVQLGYASDRSWVGAGKPRRNYRDKTVRWTARRMRNLSARIDRLAP
jgi:hypothetical protein